MNKLHVCPNNNLSKFVTKKNVGGSFTFEAYNSKEYTDGISFAINQDGQYKVNHVLDNKWGNAAVLVTKDDLLSIDVKKYTSGALSKGSQKEINLTFESRTGYTRRYFVGELFGTGSNSIIVNVHGSTLSFFAFNTDADITATILCIYTKD